MSSNNKFKKIASYFFIIALSLVTIAMFTIVDIPQTGGPAIKILGKVNGISIDTSQYGLFMQEYRALLKRQKDRSPDDEMSEEIESSMMDRAFNTTARELLLEDYAKEKYLFVPDSELIDKIKNLYFLDRKTGQMDNAAYEQFVQRGKSSDKITIEKNVYRELLIQNALGTHFFLHEISDIELKEKMALSLLTKQFEIAWFYAEDHYKNSFSEKEVFQWFKTQTNFSEEYYSSNKKDVEFDFINANYSSLLKKTVDDFIVLYKSRSSSFQKNFFQAARELNLNYALTDNVSLGSLEIEVIKGDSLSRFRSGDFIMSLMKAAREKNIVNTVQRDPFFFIVKLISQSKPTHEEVENMKLTNFAIKRLLEDLNKTTARNLQGALSDTLYRRANIQRN